MMSRVTFNDLGSEGLLLVLANGVLVLAKPPPYTQLLVEIKFQSIRRNCV